MRRTLALALTLILMACGGGGGSPAPAPVPVPASGTVHFSCMSVDNDQTCSGTKVAPRVWESGAPVDVSGSPMPVDYINLEVVNDTDHNVSVFVYSLVTIAGCGDNPVAFDAVYLAPGEAVVHDYQLLNYVCGLLGPQSTEVLIYDASGFNPSDYENPWTYPRDTLITNGVVGWTNIP